MTKRVRWAVGLCLAAAMAQPALAQEQGPKPAVTAKSAMASSSNPTVTKAMVEGHGGTVGVRSEPGRGSTFWFTLPLTQEALVEQARPTETAIPSAS